jgi:excisionase family DNA binding protein
MSVRLARTVSVDEVAQVLGISRNHAFRCVGRGEIPSVRIRRRVLVPAAFLDRLLGDQELVADPLPADGPARRGSSA